MSTAVASLGALVAANGATAIAWCSIGLLLVAALVVWARSSPQKPTGAADTSAHAPRVLPSTWRVVGNLPQLVWNMHRFHDWMTECCEHFQGAPFAMEMPARLNPVFIYTPAGVEDVLKTHFETINKGPHMGATLHDVFGEGIFAVDGAAWAHQRKTASHLFSTNALREALGRSVGGSTAALLRVLQRASERDDAIDLYRLLNRFTIEAFAKMGFGIDMKSLESDHEHPFQAAFDSAQRILTYRFMRPVWFWKIQRALGVGLEGQLKRDVAVIDKTVMDIIAQSLERRAHTQEKPIQASKGDIMSLFLDRIDETEGETFDPRRLRDVVVNFLIAGRDSTAQTMSWCLYNLSSRPEIVAKIRAEIARVLPDVVSGARTEPPTMDEVQPLVFLEAVLKETLRLHPPVPVIPKFVLQDTVLSDGTFIPARTEISIPTYAMGRMEFIWGSDAKQFKPERWIDPATGKLVNVSAYKFVSFNAGPRMCLGMNLALVEMKIVLASALSRFDIELVPDQHITYYRSMTLPVKGAMLARIKTAAAPA